jgi:hypothetical protein
VRYFQSFETEVDPIGQDRSGAQPVFQPGPILAAVVVWILSTEALAEGAAFAFPAAGGSFCKGMVEKDLPVLCGYGPET